MKWMFTFITIMFNAILSPLACAETGSLFNVRFATLGFSSAPHIRININTTAPGWLYQSAGIKLTTPECHIVTSATDCNASDNGFCLFSVSDTKTTQISLSCSSVTLLNNPLPIPPISMRLCLNGTGLTYSCEEHTLTLPPPI